MRASAINLTTCVVSLPLFLNDLAQVGEKEFSAGKKEQEHWEGQFKKP